MSVDRRMKIFVAVTFFAIFGCSGSRQNNLESKFLKQQNTILLKALRALTEETALGEEESKVGGKVLEEAVMMTKTHKEEYGSGTFEFDSAKLTDSVSERLDNLANFLNEYPQAQVEITGYTDSSGPEAYNLKLSERRAQAVAEYLIAAGIDADRFTVTGMGEANPVADNSTHEGREKNRRVEVVVPEFQYEELVQPE